MSAESDPGLHTTGFHLLVDRLRAGDQSAAEELFGHVGVQLERMARKMLRRFPDVCRWEQTGDVVQNAVVRLLRALQEVRPDSMRAFFGLAATQMRRELIDLARHYRGALGHGANHASGFRAADAADTPVLDPAEPAADAEDLERWAAFHAAVEELPAEEREVVGLTFYHGWTQAEMAQLFQVDERTIRRRWRSACQRLSDTLQGELPQLED